MHGKRVISLVGERNKSTKVFQFQKDFITNPFIYKNVINNIYLQITLLSPFLGLFRDVFH